ncbi:MAG: hypothetical protein HFH69_13090 [Lachnospiraceae bacterium]|nr:hypothetical protein [Lachnospiraceae bacterium]
MSKIEINFELLDLFNEEEIYTVCKNADLTLFLMLIKDKRYIKYAKTLGRLDKKSALVQKLLPRIAFNLFKKGEEPFKTAIATQLDTYKEKFGEAISKCMEHALCVDNINAYNTKEMAELYFKILDISTTDIPTDLFFIFLKLQDIMIEKKFRQGIETEIGNISKARTLEAKHQEEIQEALKEQEKRLSVDFEQQKRDLGKQIEEKDILYKEIQEKLNATEHRLQKYENITQAERKRREEEWFSEYEKELKARKVADDIQWKNASDEAEAKHQNLLLELEAEAEKKRAELEEQYRKQLISSEELLSNELAELRLQVAELIDKKKVLDAQVDALEQRKKELDNSIQELDAIEDRYFESFEQRVIERKIDSIIFQKLGYENQRDNANADVPLVCSNLSNVVVIPARQFNENAEYGADVSSIEDFFEDYKTNISLYFDNETEVAGAVLAAILHGMGIIAIDKVCNYLSGALAALLHESSPLVINIDSEKESLKMLVDIVNESEAQVVCIKGILDNYNEILFARMCEVCKEKYLFFAMFDLKNLEMMSKAMLNYSIVIDAENELHFSVDDCLLIGNHDLKPLIPELDMKKSQEIYKKTFSRLVMNGYIRKSASIEYSSLLQLYFALVGGNTLGEIMQKGIIYACDVCSENENLGDVLNKSGITIPMK